MRILLSIIGMVASFYMIKKREQIGDMMGQADWMRYFGGVYNLVVYIAIIVFFWALSELTGTTNIFFLPLKWIFPASNGPPSDLI